MATIIWCSLCDSSSDRRATRIGYVSLLLVCMLASVGFEIDYAIELFCLPRDMVT